MMKRLLIVVFALIIANFCFVTETLAVKITPEQIQEINQQWANSIHSLNEVNCSSCHLNEETKAFISQPDQESCRSCHELPVETFLLGQHGIRTAEGLTPLTVEMARLPMKESALNQEVTCNSCHNVHSVNTFVAAVDSCLSCHNDTHSLNYKKKSKHFNLVTSAGVLPRPSNGTVTCSTCHLPRETHGSTIHVNHNNTYNLLPRDRMVKDVCINCHGMEFAYNSIFDDELVTDNFSRSPTLKLETFDLIRALEERRSS